MQHRIHIFLLLLFFIGLKSNALAQGSSRLSGQLIYKEKNTDGIITLTSGYFFYDSKYKKLLFDVIFPQKVTWVTKDSLLYKFEKNKLVEKKATLTLPEFSIFNLALSGQLQDFGLKKSGYKLDKIENSKESVIYTYVPPKQLSSFGKVKLMLVKNQLNTVLIYGKSGKILSKQLFTNYFVDKGIAFPQSVKTITYIENKESFSISTYSNIKINDFKDNKNYNYPLPDK